MECKTTIAIAWFSLAAIAAPTHAAEQRFYGAAGITSSNHDVNIPADENQLSSVDTESAVTGFSLAAGYRAHRHLAFEVSYLDLGSAAVTEHFTDLGDGTAETIRGTSEISGPAVSALVFLPLGEQFEPYLRAGWLFAEIEARTEGFDFNVLYDDSVWMAGLGVNWTFASRWSARLEYAKTADIRIGSGSEVAVDAISLSALFRF